MGGPIFFEDKFLKRGTLAERFWSKVDTRSSGCWLWIGARHGKGYGHLRIGSKVEKAHRVAWLLSHGNIPDGLEACHSCDTPPCVKPSHLFLGTDEENLADRQKKFRQAHGQRNGKTKLTEEEVRAMRRQYGSGITPAAIAKNFGASIHTVTGIVRRTRWVHLVTIVAACVLSSFAEAKQFPSTRHRYPVLEVHDADTVLLQTSEIVSTKTASGSGACATTPGQMTIRLLGINAPEVKGPFGRADQPGGPEGRKWLSDKLGCTLGKKPGAADINGFNCSASVWVEYASGGRKDKYGRVLAWLHTVPDGVMLNLEEVRLGIARVYFPVGSPKLDPTYVKALNDAQAAAQSKSLGIWSKPAPVRLHIGSPFGYTTAAYRHQVGDGEPIGNPNASMGFGSAMWPPNAQQMIGREWYRVEDGALMMDGIRLGYVGNHGPQPRSPYPMTLFEWEDRPKKGDSCWEEGKTCGCDECACGEYGPEDECYGEAVPQ